MVQQQCESLSSSQNVTPSYNSTSLNVTPSHSGTPSRHSASLLLADGPCKVLYLLLMD